ncbi:MAG: hypothetical protein DMF77_22780 [Acidobacteria bacterium]|nr:MAG: hypothetical protein DMF77_22780 [Acidobacteriota bacterium]
MITSCTSCRGEMPPGARFCPQCAAPVGPGEPATGRDSLEAALGSRYTVVRLLGRGGMGAVYLGRETALDREVAIKVLPADRGEGQDVERFRREARTAARLMHPNIVPLHGWGEAQSTPYFVMGYVRGEPLSVRMRRGLAPEAARRILADLADALDYAHRQGVVHRDIKPDNVLIDDESGRPMLTDFGVAKATGAGHTLTTAGSVVGTPHYMSPEQAGGKGDVDGRSDIYSLGIMGYAMLAGRLPFEASNTADILVQHLTKTPAPLRPLLPPDVPDALVAAIERCLEKDPAARWPDARALRDALVAAGEDGDDVPDELADVAGWGVWMAAGVLLTAYLFLSWLLSGADPFIESRSALLAVVAVALFTVKRVRGSGGFRFGAAAVMRALFLQPIWWNMWYPRAWRRRGDVFDRLPAPHRLARMIMAAFVPFYLFWLFPVIVVGHAVMTREARLIPFGYVATPAAVLLFLLTALAVQAVRAQLWARRNGVGRVESARLLWASTAKRAPWARPPMARLLERNARAVPLTPQACLRALITMAAEVSGPARTRADEAVMAGRRLLAAIDAHDRELARLATDSDPGEADRLRMRLAAFGPKSATEGEDRRRMRGLLAQQLEVVAAMRDRVTAVQEERERSTGALTTLYRLVAELVGRLPGGAGGRALEGRLQDACAEAWRLVRAEAIPGLETAVTRDLPLPRSRIRS